MSADGDATRPATGGPQIWRSRLGVILAVAGSAVGLGNFLRFPGQVAAHGGGAFMIPYFCALLLLGLPVGIAEWTIGRYGGRHGLHSTPAILGLVGRGAPAAYLGTIGLVIPLVVFMYYGLIESWCLRYAWDYATGALQLAGPTAQQVATAKQHFAAVTGSAYDGVILGGHLDPAVLFWAVVLVLNLWLVYRGVSRGIERFCGLAMPAMALCALLVLARVLTLGAPDALHPERSVLHGLGFMWNPDTSRLGDFDTWLAAAGQIFFSLSVGFGVIVNYASYVPADGDVVLSGITASATNEVFEVSFGGLITIPAAFVFLGASGAGGGTFSLGFTALPVVFEQLGSPGRWIGATWYLMLFLAAVTSSISMFQPAKAFFEESLAMGRGGAMLIVALISGGGSFWVIWFSKDLVALETLDFWVGTLLLFVLSAVQIICFSWVLGVDRGLAEARRGALVALPGLLRPLMRYVTPAYLIVVFVGFAARDLPGHLAVFGHDRVARHTGWLILAVLALVVLATRRGVRRWRERWARAAREEAR